jgi:hypothetical protein
MASRNLLHKSRLAAFLEWAALHGASVEPGKGQFQKARFRFPGEAPHIIYDKLTGEHYSLENKTVPLFWKFHVYSLTKLEEK